MARRGMPDVLGQLLQRAVQALAAAGWQVRVIETAPPQASPRGPRRVVRQCQAADGTVVLTAAAQVQLEEP